MAAVREAAAQYTWERTVEKLIAVYREAAVAPARASSEPRESLSDLAMSLVGPKGLLTPDDQLALLAVSARPALKRTVFSALRGGLPGDVPGAAGAGWRRGLAAMTDEVRASVRS